MFMFFVMVLTFGFAWWLGFYLLMRYVRGKADATVQSPANARLKYVSWGLLSYAAAVVGLALVELAPTDLLSGRLMAFTRPLIFFPTVFWIGAMLSFWPDNDPQKERLERGLDYGLPAAALLLFMLASNTTFIFAEGAPGRGYWILIGALAVLMLINLVLAVNALQQAPTRQRSLIGWAVASTLFFALGLGLILFPLNWLPVTWVVLGIGVDLVVLGIIVGFLDALEEGETLRPEMLRSFATAAGIALIFGGQIGLFIASTALTFTLMVLLISTVATAILLATWANLWQRWLDRLVFAQSPQVQQVREALRSAADDVARQPEPHALLLTEEEEFTRLTRRALSHLGNLPRLANSPLIDLPMIDEELTTLERAASLKLILTESIDRLKPPAANGSYFAPTDEWRFYNALYFPYVVGLKPYSRRMIHEDLDAAAEQALHWFQQQVPERTLYNWQKAAAQLIAQDLREMMTAEGATELG